MPLDEAPPFWWRRSDMLAMALLPASAIWGYFSAVRMNRPPVGAVNIPVLCIGNFIVGGAGKTPTVLAFGAAAKKQGYKPGFLSRGYGGRISGPAEVCPEKHNALDVGDEPLLLAEEGLTAVSANRVDGATFLAARGCNFIIMDDGFQNPGLEKDFNLVVVDAKRGIGNGYPIPSGPLRAPLRVQMAKAHGVLVVGEGPAGDWMIRQAARMGKPVYTARTVVKGKRGAWKKKKVLAFAGIADPDKLADSLQAAGAIVSDVRAFRDHHNYTDEEITELLRRAAELDAMLVTTAKDKARLRGGTPMQLELDKASKTLPIRIEFDDPRAQELVLDATVKNADRRRLGSGAAQIP